MVGEDLSDEVWDEVWNAVLGPSPDDLDPGGNPYSSEGGARGPGDYDLWPPEDEGPHNGIFWHRWIEEQLIADGATVEAAKALRATMRRALQTGDLKVVAVHADGRAQPIPPEVWQAAGGKRFLWWSGIFTFDGEPGNVYLIDPPPAAPPKEAPAGEPGSRERNNVARLVGGLVLIVYSSLDRHGIITEIVRDLEKRGIRMSDGTVAKWINAAGKPERAPTGELRSRERNNVARLVYGLALVAYRGDLDKQGAIVEIVRDLEVRDIRMSVGEVAMWINAGRELYDRNADATRNPN